MFGLYESIMAPKLDSAAETKILLLLESKGGRYPRLSRATAGLNATPTALRSKIAVARSRACKLKLVG